MTDKQTEKAEAWNARISLDAVRVTPAGIQTTRYAFAIAATGSTQSGPWTSLDYAKAYLEAAGWKCSEIEVTTSESSTPPPTEKPWPDITERNTSECETCGRKMFAGESSSTGGTD